MAHYGILYPFLYTCLIVQVEAAASDLRLLRGRVDDLEVRDINFFLSIIVLLLLLLLLVLIMITTIAVPHITPIMPIIIFTVTCNAIL